MMVPSGMSLFFASLCAMPSITSLSMTVEKNSFEGNLIALAGYGMDHFMSSLSLNGSNIPKRFLDVVGLTTFNLQPYYLRACRLWSPEEATTVYNLMMAEEEYLSHPAILSFFRDECFSKVSTDIQQSLRNLGLLASYSDDWFAQASAEELTTGNFVFPLLLHRLARATLRRNMCNQMADRIDQDTRERCDSATAHHFSQQE